MQKKNKIKRGEIDSIVSTTRGGKRGKYSHKKKRAMLTLSEYRHGLARGGGTRKCKLGNKVGYGKKIEFHRVGANPGPLAGVQALGKKASH